MPGKFHGLSRKWPDISAVLLPWGTFLATQGMFQLPASYAHALVLLDHCACTHSFCWIRSDHYAFCGSVLSLTRPQSSLGFLWMGDSPWRREWMELLGETEGTHTKLQPGSNLLLVSISDLRSPLSKLPSLENFKRCTRKSVIGCFPHARTRSSWLAVDRGGGLIFLHHLSHVFANVRYAIPIYTYCSPFLI